MRLAGFAVLIALLTGGAAAQTVSKPAGSKPVVTKPATTAPAVTLPQGGAIAQNGNAAAGEPLTDAQKEAQKDRRQDRDTSSATALAAKGAKLEQENAQIAGQMGEAKDKAANAMASANVQLATGIGSTVVQAGGGAQGQPSAPQKIEKGNPPALKPCKDCVAPVKPQ